ncbi:MAG: Rieske Fe-S protein [Halobacteriales archaeon]|jgi:Rieske Fe-S protein
MSEEDKYPGESDRRRFVKGVVGVSALMGTASLGGVTINSLTAPTGEGGGTVVYRGVENTAGPAPRGMPQIPVEIDDEGYLKGRFPEYETTMVEGREVRVARMEVGGMTYGVQWFQYCGVQSYAGIQPDADQDEYFRYSSGSGYDWQKETVSEGDRVHVDHFSDYETWGNEFGTAGVGKPGAATWRSQGLSGKDTIPVLILRSKRVEEMVADSDDPWLQAATQDGFMAILNKCTHFCCVPGFKTTGDAAKFGAANEIYCPCHQSVYDPFSFIETNFTALPRPRGD